MKYKAMGSLQTLGENQTSWIAARGPVLYMTTPQFLQILPINKVQLWKMGSL